MRQFLKYEFKNNWKSFLLSYLLIISSFLILSIFIMFVKDVVNTTPFMSILYSNLVILTVGAMIASVVLFIINIVKSMYNSIFTDEGYLTLSFPKSTDSLIISKFIANVVWELLYGVAVGIGIVFLYVSLFVAFGQPVNDLFVELQLLFANLDLSFGIAIFAIINLIVEAILGFILLFLAFCVVNTGIAKKGKVIIGILLYSGFSYVLSLIDSIASTISFGFAVDGSGGLVFAYGAIYSESFLNSNAIMYVFDFTSFLINVGLIIGLYIACRKILRNHLELE